MEKKDSQGSVHLSDDPLTERQAVRGLCGEEAAGGGGRGAVNKHIFMYGPRLRSALPPRLWLTARRGASHFFRLTQAHMAWQWLSHHLRRNRGAVRAPYSDPTCFAAAIRLGNRREKRETEDKSSTLVLSFEISNNSLCPWLRFITLTESERNGLTKSKINLHLKYFSLQNFERETFTSMKTLKVELCK